MQWISTISVHFWEETAKRLLRDSSDTAKTQQHLLHFVGPPESFIIILIEWGVCDAQFLGKWLKLRNGCVFWGLDVSNQVLMIGLCPGHFIGQVQRRRTSRDQ